MLHVPAKKGITYAPSGVSTPPEDRALPTWSAGQSDIPCLQGRTLPPLQAIRLRCRRIPASSTRKGFRPFSNGARQGQVLPDRRQHGFTLIELMVIIAVLGVLVAIALPSFKSTIDRRNLVGAANDIFAGLQYARSEAIKRNQNIEFQFDAAATPWCYGISDPGNGCDCNASPENCTVDGQQNVVTGDNFRNVSLSATGFDSQTDFEFEPRRGSPTREGNRIDGSFGLTVAGQSRTVVLNALGRVTVE
jgi:type IV fimbrial biogenesis protein FimT